MATRARIGIELENGKTLSIYSHWDNYPSYNGAILLLYYSNELKVRELLTHGDMSSLGIRSGGNVAHDFDERKRENKSGFNSLCTFYHRDRGESINNAIEMTKKEMLNEEQYSYLWKDGKWWWGRQGMKRFYPLGDKRCEITKEMHKIAKEELGLFEKACH